MIHLKNDPSTLITKDEHSLRGAFKVFCSGKKSNSTSSKEVAVFYPNVGEKIKIKNVLAEFQWEIKILKTLDRKNSIYIPKFLGVCNDGSFITELCDCCLSTLFFNNFVNPRHNFSYTAQELELLALDLFKAVAYLHSIKWVHRDLKPSNFLIASFSIKIGDWAMAECLKGNSANSTSFHGTHCWAPPEYVKVLGVRPKVSHKPAWLDAYSDDVWRTALSSWILLTKTEFPAWFHLLDECLEAKDLMDDKLKRVLQGMYQSPFSKPANDKEKFLARVLNPNYYFRPNAAQAVDLLSNIL